MKTTSDLLALRSDAYEVLEDGQVRLTSERQGVPPVITLSEEYKLVDSLEALGIPSLIGCRSLTVKGPVHFESGVVLRGDVSFENLSGASHTVKNGVYENYRVRL